MNQVALSTWDRAIGGVLAAVCPMFLDYGTMLYTPVTSLPFGLLSILVWQRSQASGIDSWSRLATAVLSVAAGWQAALAAGLTVLIDAARRSTRSAVLGAGGILLGSKIGRASWRERVCPYVYISVVHVSLKKKTT